LKVRHGKHEGFALGVHPLDSRVGLESARVRQERRFVDRLSWRWARPFPRTGCGLRAEFYGSWEGVGMSICGFLGFMPILVGRIVFC
jgi:hypothetical protein